MASLIAFKNGAEQDRTVALLNAIYIQGDTVFYPLVDNV
jgi:hypothetical protein